MKATDPIKMQEADHDTEITQMDNRKERELESMLTARCGRPVKVAQRSDHQICVVFEMTGDRGRVELAVSGAGTGWRVSDRGAIGALFGLDLDDVVPKLSAIDAELVRQGDEIVTHSHGRSLCETVAEFVDSIEFVPVLAGLFTHDIAA